ncbi:hypothetical protein [Blastococcus sp. TF02A_35]|nr:hypothetical protein [Blastococcus sp. TF02A_35]
MTAAQRRQLRDITQRIVGAAGSVQPWRSPAAEPPGDTTEHR